MLSPKEWEAMSYKWPANAVFRELTLDVEELTCPECQHPRVVESRRDRRFFTCEGPVHLTCQLRQCSNRKCPQHKTLVSPEGEMRLAMPYCVLGWDVFCWLGHRRFARHWSVPQIRHELQDRFEISLSSDAVEEYVSRYQQMVAARQQDSDELKKAYRGVKGLALSIDGLQPEKGHETLYVVREIGQGRVWFAVALLSSNAAELERVLRRAKEMAEELGLPVRCWVSDKQKAFVKAIAKVFPGVPHRYCTNHCLRDLAKAMLEADSNAKVQMRKKVRGLRKIEQAVEAEQAAAVAVAAVETPLAATSANVVLNYCAAVRGILNDNRGGPLHPPGERMAEALIEVREAILQNPEAKKGGPQGRI
jgi:hypothetical protein